MSAPAAPTSLTTVMALIRRRLSGEPSRWREFEHSMEAFTSGTLDPRTAAARIERLFAGDEQILRSLRALFRGDEPESEAEDGGAAMPRFRARFAAAAAHALENQFIAEPPIAKGPNEEYDAFFYVKRTAPPAAAAAVSEIAPIAPPVMASESAADATATANASSNPSWRSSLPVVERLARQSRDTLSNAFRRKSSELIEENWIELQSQLNAQRGHWSALRRNFSARARAPTLRHSSVPAAASSAASVASGVPRIPSMLVPAVPQPHRGDVATYTCRVYDEHVTKRAVESLASPEFTSYRWHAVGGGKTKKKGSKARHVASMSTVVLTSAFVAPLPKSVGYVSVTQNFRAEDEPVLRYVPYFGDDDTASIDVSYYEAVPGELEREITDEVDEQVLMSITNKFGVSDVVYLALSNTLGFAPVVLQKRRKEIEEMERRFESFAQHPDVVERLRSDSAVTQAHRPPSGVLFTALTRYGDVSGNLPHTKELGLRCAPLTLMLESYRELFCRRCFRYDCHEHGVSQPLPRKRARPDAIPPAPCCGWTLAPASRFALRAREEAGAHNEDDVEEEDGSGAKARSRSGKKPCGTRCWMSATAPAARGSRSSKRQKRAKEKASGNAVQVECSPEWGLIETELLAKCAAIFGRTRCCVIARALQSKTCAQVHALLESQARESAASASASARDLSVPLPASPAVPRGRHSSRLARAENMKHNSALYEPCDHDGPCTAENKCGCVLRKGFCEKFCACAKGKRCHNRFTGCRCAGGKGACTTGSCPCVAAYRECDPDLCISCGAAQRPEDRAKHVACCRFPRKCNNINIRAKQRVPLFAGRSRIAGWGAFAATRIAKDSFIAEYVGDTLSQNEANRRGKIYDKLKCSFLFNLNDQYVVDATRKGCKIKFANHSSDPSCFCKVLLVDGDHKIGIFAKREILAGEELHFDYAYSEETGKSVVTKQSGALALPLRRGRLGAGGATLTSGGGGGDGGGSSLKQQSSSSSSSSRKQQSSSSSSGGGGRVERTQSAKQSMYPNVTRKSEKKWTASIRFKNKRNYLGTFTSEIDAARAADAFEITNKCGRANNGNRRVPASSSSSTSGGGQRHQ